MCHLHTILLLMTLIVSSVSSNAQIYVSVRQYIADTLRCEREYISISPEALAKEFRIVFSHDTSSVPVAFGIPFAETVESRFLNDVVETINDSSVGDTVYKYPNEAEKIRRCAADTFVVRSSDTVSLILVSNVVAEWRFLRKFRREETPWGTYTLRSPLQFTGAAMYPVRFFSCARIQGSILKSMLQTLLSAFPSMVVELHVAQ